MTLPGSGIDETVSRRDLLRSAVLTAAALVLPGQLAACRKGSPRDDPRRERVDPDQERLTNWTGKLHAEGLTGPETPLGRSTIRVGELAVGTPYVPYTLEAYLKAGRSPLQ